VGTPWRDESEKGGLEWSAVDDAALLAALARGIEPAIAEFYRRFIDVLIAVARRHGVAAGERRARASEFLDDAALRLADWRHAAPRSLVAYLATSFRRRLGMDWRAERRATQRHGATLSEVADGSQWVVAEMCSEYAIRSATSPDEAAVDEERGLPDETRTGLAQALWEAMSAEEQHMMGYLAERYPQREIAERLGLTPSATRVRILRLRQRLRKAAAQYVATLPTQDGIALARILATPRGQIAQPDRGPARRTKT
jgi:RNA polymerase sigma factor (sigma-70 family)